MNEFPYLSMYGPIFSDGSILGSGYLALIDEGSISSAKTVGGDCFSYLSMYDPLSSGGSILGSGYLALVDEGSISSAKAVGGDCISILVRV